MLTPILNPNDKKPLYEQLYLFIRASIENGQLKTNERLPSKRKLATHLRVSLITVENAYAQLLMEGYLCSLERRGYFVSGGQMRKTPAGACSPTVIDPVPQKNSLLLCFNLKTNAVNTEDFPYSTWSKLMREAMRQDSKLLLEPVHPQGDYALRVEIAAYLRDFRGVDATPEQIILGAGTEYLLGLICELLPDRQVALEDPGYHKIGKVLQGRHVQPLYIKMDREGIDVAALAQTASSVAIVTPSHHFPLGTVMSAGRRRQLLAWAEQADENYIIEDDFDSEFRYLLRPISSLQNLNPAKVIYLNSFAKTLAPSLRIAYMVLPEKLLNRYWHTMMFYSCTVSAFEQHTLQAFLRNGCYERHLNRMRTIYRARRDAFIDTLAEANSAISSRGKEAGLHLLLQVPHHTEAALVKKAAQSGVGVSPLSAYYHTIPDETHTVVAGYGGLKEAELKKAAQLLAAAWR